MRCAIPMVEPPKSYGPHVPIIVSQTSDSSTCKSDNFGSLSGVLWEPRIIHILISSRINYRNIIVLQQLYNYTIDYIRVNSGRLITISLQLFIKLLQS
jgi:hypothetical protein